jgi:hypothetical protein
MKILFYIILTLAFTNTISKTNIKVLPEVINAEDNYNLNFRDQESNVKNYFSALYVEKSAQSQKALFLFRISAETLPQEIVHSAENYPKVTLAQALDSTKKVFDVEVQKETIEYIVRDMDTIFLACKVEGEYYYLAVTIRFEGEMEFFATFQPKEKLQLLLSNIEKLDKNFYKFCLLSKELEQNIWSSLGFISLKKMEVNNNTGIKNLDSYFDDDIFMKNSGNAYLQEIKAEIDKKIQDIFDKGPNEKLKNELKAKIRFFGLRTTIADKLAEFELGKGFLKYYFKDKLYQKYLGSEERFIEHFPQYGKLSINTKAKKDNSVKIVEEIKPMFHPDLRQRKDLESPGKTIFDEVIFANESLLLILRDMGKNVGIRYYSDQKGKLKTQIQTFREYQTIIK